MSLNSDDRLQNEKSFHDKKYIDHESFPLHYKYHPTLPIFKAMIAKIGDVKGKKILEFGCGTGWITAELASLGAFVDAFDISSEAIEQAEVLIASINLLDKCSLKVMNAESLDYENDTFDVVFGFAILHHLDLSKALPEICRVLKPGARAYFAEPLGYNPLINLYRKFTPNYRTIFEKPMRFEDVNFKDNMFKSIKHEEFYFLALISFIFIYIPFLNKLYPIVSEKLMLYDKYILSKNQYIGKLSWYTILEFEK